MATHLHSLSSMVVKKKISVQFKLQHIYVTLCVYYVHTLFLPYLSGTLFIYRLAERCADNVGKRAL